MHSRKNKKLPAHAEVAPHASISNLAVDNNETYTGATGFKKEILVWIFSILAAVVVYILFAFITLTVYHPDVNALKEKADSLLLMPYLANPKPVESMLFRIGVLTMVPMLLGFYFLFSKMKWITVLTRKIFFAIFSGLCVTCVAALVFFDFASDNTPGGTGKRIPALPDGARDSTFNFFFSGFFIGDYLWLYALVVVPLMAFLFFFGIKKYHWENKKVVRITGLITGYVVIGIVLFAIVDMNTFIFPYSNNNKYDLNAVYYSMTQVYAGVPMLVDGFTNTYGLYPHFLNPLFQFIGLNVLKFSAVMSALLGLAFVLNFYSVKKFVRNQMILFLGFATMVFFSYLDRKLTTEFDSYFALFPIRYIIPCVLLFLARFYLVKPSMKIYWATSVIMAFFVLWNPEVGIICYISWIAVNIYRDFYTADGKINIRKFLFHLSGGICVLFAAFYTYKLVIYLSYGSSPDLGLLWKTMSVFSNLGFMALPMTLVNPWNLIALILMIGFLYAMAKLCHKAVTPRSSFVFLLALIGLGYMFYFQCRSHNGTLYSCVGFTILLLTVLGDELWQLIKNRNVFLLNALFVVFLFLISFSFIELVFNAGSIYKMVRQDEDKQVTSVERKFIEDDTKLILNNSKEHEKINVMTLMKLHGLYFDGYKRISAFNPGLMDMFLNTDLERFQDMIRDSSFSIFIDLEHYNYPFMRRVVAEVSALYDFTTGGAGMAMLNKRKTRIPIDTFFNDPDLLVIDQKYNDDTAGLRSRIDDAFGTFHIILRPEFSVQALFFSKPQVYPYAAVVGNSGELRGFAICNTFGSPNYVFAVNGKGFNVELPYNKWIYAAMNVYTDHMDVYINGNHSNTYLIDHPILQGEEKLSIGNLLNSHYFVGAIAEVAVNNKVLDSVKIKQTWWAVGHAVGW